MIAKLFTQAELEKTFGQRAVTLCDGRAGLRGGMHCTVKAAEGKPIITFTASDETLDRYDEIVSASGWKLDAYRKNPVFQNSHKYGDIMFTLGKAVGVEVKNGALVQDIEFAVDINPVARLAYDLYKGGFLNAVSVGFIPLKWEDGNQKAGYSRKYLEQELLELSAVSIPANPNALQNAVKSGAVDKADLRDLADFLKDFCSDKPNTEPHGSAPGSDIDGAQLLHLARDVKRVLRGM